MPRVSRVGLISRRVAELRKTVAVDTQNLREKLLKNLEMIFDNAVLLAKGKLQLMVKY